MSDKRVPLNSGEFEVHVSRNTTDDWERVKLVVTRPNGTQETAGVEMPLGGRLGADPSLRARVALLRIAEILRHHRK